MAKFELSEKKYKNGRRPFKAVLYELQPPDCVDVEKEVGTKYNKNGITFLEEYCSQKLDSIKDMSVTVEFLNDERTQIYGHGYTGEVDDLPTFDNATVIGHFTEGYIDDVDVNGETIRAVCGKGFLDEMRYKGFAATLEEELNNGSSVDGSIEIYHTQGNDSIVYKYGWKDKGRIPVEFFHCGWSLVLNPADTSSTLVELNQTTQNKEEQIKMDEKEIKAVVQSTIAELNDSKKDYEAKIAELNSTIESKDTELQECKDIIEKNKTEINSLNATVEQVQKALDELNKEHATYWEERKALEKELGKLKAEKRIAEMNEAISSYTDDEKKYAEVEINSFMENPVDGDIDAIKSKICVGIVSKLKEDEKKKCEMNSANHDVSVEDIFTEMCSDNEDNEDIDIFN